MTDFYQTVFVFDEALVDVYHAINLYTPILRFNRVIYRYNVLLISEKLTARTKTQLTGHTP